MRAKARESDAMRDPIAYTYDADVHCPDCALERFGCDASGFIAGEGAEDSEGNAPGALAPWDEWHVCERNSDAVLACGTCGEEIERCDFCASLPACSHALPDACDACDADNAAQLPLDFGGES